MPDETHADLCSELADQYRSLSHLESHLLVIRRNAWESCQESSLGARDRYVDHASVDLCQEIILTKGNIRALEYTLRAVEWDTRSPAK